MSLLICSRVLIVCQHERNLAFCTLNGDESGVVKLVPPKSKEAVIVRKLQCIKDVCNPLLPNIRIAVFPWDPSFSIVLMPKGNHCHVNAGNLLSLSVQLVSGVKFLHDHGVAHLDLKSDNLLLSSTGRLSIIDFSVLELCNRKTILRGFVGTQGCVCPEIAAEMPFSPFLADVWACGKLLNDMCNGACADLPLVLFVLRQAQKLMNADPKRRPSLTDVLAFLDNLNNSPPVFRSLPLQHLNMNVAPISSFYIR